MHDTLPTLREVDIRRRRTVRCTRSWRWISPVGCDSLQKIGILSARMRLQCMIFAILSIRLKSARTRSQVQYLSAIQLYKAPRVPISYKMFLTALSRKTGDQNRLKIKRQPIESWLMLLDLVCYIIQASGPLSKYSKYWVLHENHQSFSKRFQEEESNHQV